jgi:putative methylase
MITKSRLAILLSKLKGFEHPKLLAEQYMTDSEAAADMLWLAYMLGDIDSKVIADFGCGTGILGIGCCLLGAKKAYLIDNDADAIKVLMENLSAEKISTAEVVNADIKDFNDKADVVLQNPPFGTKAEHADRAFLQKAFSTAPIVYSLHKSSTSEFVIALANDRGFKVTHRLKIMLPLKASQPFHRKKSERIDVEWFRMSKAL